MKFVVGDTVRVMDWQASDYLCRGVITGLSPSTEKRALVKGHGLQWCWRVEFEDKQRLAGYFAECFLEKVS